MRHKPAKNIFSLYPDIPFIDKLHIYIRLRRPFFETAEKHVPQTGKILDFGCGHGLFSLYLSSKSKHRNITAVDISKRKINLAKASRHSRRITFLYLKDTTSTLKKSQQYDAIVVINVLYLLDRNQQKQIIKKFHHALKKNGQLIITEQDSSFAFKTFYTKLREFIMVRVFRLTSGKTLTFNPHSWWLTTLKKHFDKITFENIDKKGFQKLYLCVK